MFSYMFAFAFKLDNFRAETVSYVSLLSPGGSFCVELRIVLNTLVL